MPQVISILLTKFEVINDPRKFGLYEEDTDSGSEYISVDMMVMALHMLTPRPQPRGSFVAMRNHCWCSCCGAVCMRNDNARSLLVIRRQHTL